MPFELIQLPFAKDALAPYISAETIDFHYGKHHQAYVNNLNQLIQKTEFEFLTLPDIIKSAKGPIFNNAAQIWNHTFYWNCLHKSNGEQLSEQFASAINKTFGSLEKFKEAFTKAAVGLFGSGWVWLVKDPNNFLSIVSTSNADNPLTKNQKPLLTCDVWEHAYYIDYRNARAKYIEAFWHIVNWDFVSQNF
ncbi:MAG: superoxide dismutase [Gammaproteobacteria bacterium]|nr:superoxide dismutase [Gammaproteobacteria bacterium]